MCSGSSALPLRVTSASNAKRTRSNSWPRPYTPETPLSISRPCWTSCSRKAVCSGVPSRNSATGLDLLGDQQQARVGLVDALVGDHQRGRHRVTEVTSDAEGRVVLEADDAAHPEGSLADAGRLLGGGDLEVVEAQDRGHLREPRAVLLGGLAELASRRVHLSAQQRELAHQLGQPDRGRQRLAGLALGRRSPQSTG